MSLVSVLIGLGGVALSILSFIAGKVFSQSERILDMKRDAYRDFLKTCPVPNDAHFEEVPNVTEVQKSIGLLSLYASADVTKFASEYFADFSEAQEVLINVTEVGHPRFLRLMAKYNKMVWAMRNDAMTWTVFAPGKNSKEYRPSFQVETGE